MHPTTTHDTTQAGIHNSPDSLVGPALTSPSSTTATSGDPQFGPDSSLLDISHSSMFWSPSYTPYTSATTSFPSPSIVDNGPAMSTSFDGLTDATPPRSRRSRSLQSPNQASCRDILTILPIPILRRIFAIAATHSYQSRLVLPAVCRTFRSVAQNCEEMWDTFEILTSNRYALVDRRQVEHIISKAGQRKLAIGLGITGSGVPTSDRKNASEEAEDDSSRNLKMVHLVQSLMYRVEELILDVEDGQLEADMQRAVLALFDEPAVRQLRSLTLLGNLPLDSIIQRHPQRFASLCHLSVAFSSNFTLSIPLPQIQSLQLSVFTFPPTSPRDDALYAFLLNFPSLLTLGIHCQTGEAHPDSFPRPSNGSLLPTITLHRLESLTMEGIPLTLPLLSHLLTPNLRVLKLSDFTLGFELREVSFSTSFSDYPIDDAGSSTIGGGNAHSSGPGLGLGLGLQPLPFGVFLSSNARWGRLEEVSFKTLPSVVSRMCVDFTRVVGSLPLSDGGRSLTRLSLADFAWNDWAPLLGREATAGRHPSPPSQRNPNGNPPLPRLKCLHVHLDQVSAWKTAGFMNGKHEERQAWMDGLSGFAERRMSRRAVERMLRSFNVSVPPWLSEHAAVSSPIGRDGDATAKMNRGGEGSSRENENENENESENENERTVDYIELDTGFTDSLAFLHAAWVVLQKEHEHERPHPSSGERGNVRGCV